MNEHESNDHSAVPAEIIDVQFRPVAESWVVRPRRPARKRPLWPALTLFVLTAISTLAVGSEFASSYAAGREPFTGNLGLFGAMAQPLIHPGLLLLGIPFSFTLMGILLAHELGHYFACRFYGIDASYPYFIPAPTLFGTFGAFIAIRSPITTRRALFDVGFSGPIVGFLLALPAMAYGISASKIVPGVQGTALFVFGSPLLQRIFMAWFHPGVPASSVLLSPVARAAWVGLFATALNLLPIWQLDGGHIVYSVASKHHHRISLAVSLGLTALGLYYWGGWVFWGLLLLVLSLRRAHPPLMDRWEPLDSGRRAWAVVALAMFILCFTPWPVWTP